MKWADKGKELGEKAADILKEFMKEKEIYIFGAGIFGEEIRSVLEWYGLFAGYIDNDAKKQRNGFKGAAVISFQDYSKRLEKKRIVVAASERNMQDICSQLEKEGLRKDEDFFCHKEFMHTVFPILSFYRYDKLFVELAQICLTERCTLKCRKCAHACFNVPNTADDPPLEHIKESADIFFSRFDAVKEFVLIGGEPFLYKNIKEAIVYIGENYRDKMMVFAVTTNGTILPDDEIAGLCLKYDVTIRVSDYSDSIPQLKRQYERFYRKLAGNKVIVWKTDNEKSWFDYGFGEFDRGDSAAVLTDAFDKCKTPCREISGSKYYYCVMARSVSENLKMGIGEQDYIDLSKVKDRNILLEFQMGFSEKGYLDMCRFCRGDEAQNYLIPAAEQMEAKVR